MRRAAALLCAISACAGDDTTAPPPARCSTGLSWDLGETTASPEMNPGRPCLGCHGAGSVRPFQGKEIGGPSGATEITANLCGEE